MKYEQQGNCPYCDADRGINTPWGMHPQEMDELKKRHDAGHSENSIPLTTASKFCRNCGTKVD